MPAPSAHCTGTCKTLDPHLVEDGDGGRAQGHGLRAGAQGVAVEIDEHVHAVCVDSKRQLPRPGSHIPSGPLSA